MYMFYKQFQITLLRTCNYSGIDKSIENTVTNMCIQLLKECICVLQSFLER